MDKIKQQILQFFGSINEFDKRLYLRDCVDIMVFDHKDLMPQYPYEVFLFLKLARIYNKKLSNEQFLHFINNATEKEEEEINYFIYEFTCKGIRKAQSFDATLKKLKNLNDKIHENQYLYETSM